MTDTQIELRNVSRTYGEGQALVRALDGVDLEIRQGEFSALAGPSGSGKTTLLHLVVGWERPDDGRVDLQLDVSRGWSALAVIPQEQISPEAPEGVP